MLRWVRVQVSLSGSRPSIQPTMRRRSARRSFHGQRGPLLAGREAPLVRLSVALAVTAGASRKRSELQLSWSVRQGHAQPNQGIGVASTIARTCSRAPRPAPETGTRRCAAACGRMACTSSGAT